MKRHLLKKINEVISFNLRLLNIDKPTIKYIKGDELPTKTTKMAIDLNGNLFVNENYVVEFLKDNALLWITTSHELRHIWQLENDVVDKTLYQASSAVDKNEYNSQPEEVDAWAWSCIVINAKFENSIKFDELFNSITIAKIEARINDILNNKLY